MFSFQKRSVDADPMRREFEKLKLLFARAGLLVSWVLCNAGALAAMAQPSQPVSAGKAATVALRQR
jgi:hypothetical protein